MKTIQAASYPVHFDKESYLVLSELIQTNNYSTIFILVDENTLEHCYPRFIQNLKTDKQIEIIEIESGEINKKGTAVIIGLLELS